MTIPELKKYAQQESMKTPAVMKEILDHFIDADDKVSAGKNEIDSCETAVSNINQIIKDYRDAFRKTKTPESQSLY